ncbi:MAG: hypothetical protein F6K26_51285 [Moorea sp. SIO2I5]|nr:hypothetical protein [Moorena sp. SIO2I5]
MRYTLFFPSSLFPLPCSLLPAPCSLKTRICTSQVVELLYKANLTRHSVKGHNQ